MSTKIDKSGYPVAGSKGRQVWDACDDITAKNKRRCQRFEVMAIAKANEWNLEYTSSQFAHWRKYHGHAGNTQTEFPVKTGVPLPSRLELEATKAADKEKRVKERAKLAEKAAADKAKAKEKRDKERAQKAKEKEKAKQTAKRTRDLARASKAKAAPAAKKAAKKAPAKKAAKVAKPAAKKAAKVAKKAAKKAPAKKSVAPASKPVKKAGKGAAVTPAATPAKKTAKKAATPKPAAKKAATKKAHPANPGGINSPKEANKAPKESRPSSIPDGGLVIIPAAPEGE